MVSAKRAVNLSERKFVVRCGLGSHSILLLQLVTPSLPIRILEVQRPRVLRDSTLGLVGDAGWKADLNF